MDAEKGPTLIDVAANVDGKLSGKDAQVLGQFTGEIELTGRLHLGESARVQAKILADVVEIAGEFKGELVTRSLILLEKARVTGTIDAETLAVREGAQLNGTVSAGGKGRAAAPRAASGAMAG
jgi:cytoskeletal protein CcmA (bactofilin family)